MEALTPMYRAVFNLYAIEDTVTGKSQPAGDFRGDIQVELCQGTTQSAGDVEAETEREVSEEHNEDDKKRAAGGGFEQGLKSALEKAPGMVVPSWATMQTAMAGGAAGGAAAASWRWIIGPAATAGPHRRGLLVGSEPSSTWKRRRTSQNKSTFSFRKREPTTCRTALWAPKSNAMDVADPSVELGSPVAAEMTVSGGSELGEVDVDTPHRQSR